MRPCARHQAAAASRAWARVAYVPTSRRSPVSACTTRARQAILPDGLVRLRGASGRHCISALPVIGGPLLEVGEPDATGAAELVGGNLTGEEELLDEALAHPE